MMIDNINDLLPNKQDSEAGEDDPQKYDESPRPVEKEPVQPQLDDDYDDDQVNAEEPKHPEQQQ